MNEGASSTGRSLQELYRVVLGVAIVLAAEHIVDPGRAGVPIRWSTLPLFLAFVVTGLLSYHGSAVYLEVAYSDPQSDALRPRRVIADLALGFGALLLLVMLALLITRPVYFAAGIAILFTADVTRTVILAVLGEDVSALERRMAWLNGGAAALIAVAAAVSAGRDEAALRWAILGIAAARAVSAYVFSFSTFFGTSDPPASNPPVS